MAAEIRRIAAERILVLDGAWGTMLQGAGLAAADYRGERFAAHPGELTGDPDVLNLTRPDLIRLGAPPLPGGGRRHHDTRA